jgi:CRP-like cAMP-binding protein
MTPNIPQSHSAYFDQHWSSSLRSHLLDETHLLHDLPPSLQAEVAQHSITHLLRSLESFRHLDAFTAEAISQMATMKKVHAGFDIFRQGEPADSILLVEEGEVRNILIRGRVYKLHPTNY